MRFNTLQVKNQAVVKMEAEYLRRQKVNGLQIGIKATGKIKRSDFNVGKGLTTAFVSDEVQLRITGEFGKNL
jgi:polyisoprenoid-binding protein YceI